MDARTSQHSPREDSGKEAAQCSEAVLGPVSPSELTPNVGTPGGPGGKTENRDLSNETNKEFEGCGETGALVQGWWRFKRWGCCGNLSGSFSNIKHGVTRDTTIPLPGIYPQTCNIGL